VRTSRLARIAALDALRHELAAPLLLKLGLRENMSAGAFKAFELHDRPRQMMDIPLLEHEEARLAQDRDSAVERQLRARDHARFFE
jgi:hypothetical protein